MPLSQSLLIRSTGRSSGAFNPFPIFK